MWYKETNNEQRLDSFSKKVLLLNCDRIQGRHMETNEEEILPLRGHPGMLSSPVLGRGRGDGDGEDRGEGSLADGHTERYEAYRSRSV